MQPTPPNMTDAYTMNPGRNDVNSKYKIPSPIAHAAEYHIDLKALTNKYFYCNLLFLSIYYFNLESLGRQKSPILVSVYYDSYMST